MASEHKPLLGSEFVPHDDAEHAGAVDDDEVIMVTVVVRADESISHHHEHSRWEQHPHERTELSTEQRRGRRGAPEALERVKTFVEDHGLTVIDVSEKRRAVVVEGSPRHIANAFGVELVRYRHHRGDHHGHEGPIHLPEELHDIVESVLGLNDRPLAGTQLSGGAEDSPSQNLFQATELAKIYDFPSGFDGTGQKIGIIELSDKRHPTGYERSDLETFFAAQGLPMPKIRDVVRHDSMNRPEKATDVARFMEWMASVTDGTADFSEPPSKGRGTAEVVMDIELAGALAPGAELVIYFAPNSEGGVYHVLHDILEAGEVSVVSFSWAWKERRDSFEGMIDDLLARAADPASERPPITFCSASGDYGGSTVVFPASSPWALGCGGTSLVAQRAGEIQEKVWNTRNKAASGGGVSRLPQPKWQQGLEPNSGRGVPDVSVVADPASHCKIFAGGVWGPAGGTSAAAPIWAALVARLNQALEAEQGYLNPRLYKLAKSSPGVFRSVTDGDNRVGGKGYDAQEGWDPCTGLGSPRGTALLHSLKPS